MTRSEVGVVATDWCPAKTRTAEDINQDAIYWDTSPRRVVIDIGAGVATGDGRDTFVARRSWVVGSRFGDLIEGGPRADLVNGGRGSDVLRGHRGDDRVVADPGSRRQQHSADKVWGGPGNDALTSSAGEDRVHGGPGNDVIDDLGNSGDRLFGDTGRDLLIGELAATDAPQSYSGGKGIDRLSLLSNLVNPTTATSSGTWNMGTGRLVFNLDGPLTLSAVGIERGELSTYGTTWQVRGSDRADRLEAVGTWGTSFTGLAGDDTFWGSSYDDVFTGGPGTDRSLGMGLGDDTCIGVEVFVQDVCEHVRP